jgi:hypothetical protein
LIAAAHRVAAAGLALFVSVVGIEHLRATDLNPATHMVSEYANTGDRALMTAGFLAWAVSLAGTALLLRTVAVAVGAPSRVTVLAVLLWLAAAGVLVLAAFHTQTVAGKLPNGLQRSWAGRLHDLGSGIAAAALLLGVLVSAAALARPRWYPKAAIAIAVGAVAADVALLEVGPSVGGWRQRLLLAAACIWQLLLLELGRRPGATCRG